jgi:hypothetical protein
MKVDLEFHSFDHSFFILKEENKVAFYFENTFEMVTFLFDDSLRVFEIIDKLGDKKRTYYVYGSILFLETNNESRYLRTRESMRVLDEACFSFERLIESTIKATSVKN